MNKLLLIAGVLLLGVNRQGLAQAADSVPVKPKPIWRCGTETVDDSAWRTNPTRLVKLEVVKGKIVDAVAEKPISGAFIRLYDKSTDKWIPIVSGFSNDSGNFVLQIPDSIGYIIRVDLMVEYIPYNLQVFRSAVVKDSIIYFEKISLYAGNHTQKKKWWQRRKK